jgi:hypothetical protein
MRRSPNSAAFRSADSRAGVLQRGISEGPPSGLSRRVAVSVPHRQERARSRERLPRPLGLRGDDFGAHLLRAGFLTLIRKGAERPVPDPAYQRRSLLGPPEWPICGTVCP